LNVRQVLKSSRTDQTHQGGHMILNFHAVS
jgi:hypothetical protein